MRSSSKMLSWCMATTRSRASAYDFMGGSIGMRQRPNDDSMDHVIQCDVDEFGGFGMGEW